MGRKRSHGTGHLYEKWGSYYGRWRTSDGRLLNRKIGKVRSVGERDGLTRTPGERGFRRILEEEEQTPRPRHDAEVPSADTVADSLRQRLALSGARRSYRENCASMAGAHRGPGLRAIRITDVTTADVETLAAAMLKKGLSPKTVRNA